MGCKNSVSAMGDFIWKRPSLSRLFSKKNVNHGTVSRCFLTHFLAIALASTITDSVSVRQATPSMFESVHNPEKMGNMADQAYGGNTLTVAVNAALQTVHSGFFSYSTPGKFL